MRKQLFLVLLVLGLCLPAQQAGAQGTVSSVDITQPPAVSPDGNVALDVLVLDTDRAYLGGLTTAQIKVSEDGMAIPDADLRVAEVRPGLAVLILMDLSGSMKEPGVAAGQTRMEGAKAAAQQFATERLAPDDQVGAWGFDIQIMSREPVTPLLTLDHGAVYNAIQLMQPGPNNTALLTTASEALAELHAAPLGNMRKVLLIVSDGKDYLEKADPVRYREYREAVARRAKEFGIPIFSVGVGSYCGNAKGCVRLLPENEYNFEDLRWLADNTDGLVYEYLTADQAAGLTAFFDRLVGQGRQYRLEYTTHAPKGDHLVKVAVNSGVELSDQVQLGSPFVPPQLALLGAIPGQEFRTEEPPPTLEVTASFPDGLSRALSVVHFYVDDRAVYTDTTQPFTDTWEVKDYTRRESVTLTADAEDSILRQVVTTAPISVSVQPPFIQLLLNYISDHLVALIVGLVSLGLFLFLWFKRKQVVQVVGPAVTAVAAKTTQLLGLGPRPVARLKVIRGDHPGREYPVTQQAVWIGREGCDLITDEGLTIHRQHAYLQRSGAMWYVTDLGKPNGTWVDNVRVAPNVPSPVRPGALLRLGDVEFQFVVVGATTQVI